MSYAGYVIAAYLVFALVMLWDFLSPFVRIRQSLRAARRLAARQHAATRQPSPRELKR